MASPGVAQERVFKTPLIMHATNTITNHRMLPLPELCLLNGREQRPAPALPRETPPAARHDFLVLTPRPDLTPEILRNAPARTAGERGR